MGDKLLAIDDFDIKATTAVDEVRNHLRGEPGTPVAITFLREGVGKTNEPQTITLERSVVHIPDVKYFGKLTCHYCLVALTYYCATSHSNFHLQDSLGIRVMGLDTSI